jgi:hypothetical protein
MFVLRYSAVHDRWLPVITLTQISTRVSGLGTWQIAACRLYDDGHRSSTLSGRHLPCSKANRRAAPSSLSNPRKCTRTAMWAHSHHHIRPRGRRQQGKAGVVWCALSRAVCCNQAEVCSDHLKHCVRCMSCRMPDPVAGMSNCADGDHTASLLQEEQRR